MIESGVDPNAVDDSGQTALHVAMEFDNFAVVSTLARKGGDVNIRRRSDGRSVVREGGEEKTRQSIHREKKVENRNKTEMYGC